MALYCITSVLILDNDGRRLAGKYYTDRYATEQQKKDFEQVLRKKAQPGGQILMIEDSIVTYRDLADVTIFVTGNKDENELVLESVVNTIADSLIILLRSEVHKISILENFDYVLLVIDETIDEGIIFETDTTAIVQRVANRGEEEAGAEQTIVKALKTAQDLLMG
eukprot:TRINITY_DN6463_c0_g1_i2.p1 TRINITY_DN6463_c0_g1~~TRINITY_DN6463_c0_g1_i2.p1  ORF type:complete len:166 (+),score=36.03 TRINITY_DN6463_c0_g1_i2:119-616(+)